MSPINRKQFKDELDDNGRKYLHMLERANAIVEAVKAEHPSFDISDLFAVAIRLFLSPEQRIATGIRRRMIG